MATKITGTVGGEPLIEVEIGGVFVPWKQGIENWCSVTAVTGSPTTGTYTDADGVEWTYWQWTGNGSVTTTAGVVDCLVVGGGAGGTSGSLNGLGGRLISGVQDLYAATHTVTVGAGGSGGGSAAANAGGSSVLGPHTAFGGGCANATTNTTSSITGSSLTYSKGGSAGVAPTANRGDGGNQSGNTAGSSGVVIIRVPSAFDQV